MKSKNIIITQKASIKYFLHICCMESLSTLLKISTKNFTFILKTKIHFKHPQNPKSINIFLAQKYHFTEINNTEKNICAFSATLKDNKVDTKCILKLTSTINFCCYQRLS